MVKVIPARLEDGRVVTDEPLPDAAIIRGVSILFELSEPADPPPRGSTLPRLPGILKDVEDPRSAYFEYVAEKHR